MVIIPPPPPPPFLIPPLPRYRLCITELTVHCVTLEAIHAAHILFSCYQIFWVKKVHSKHDSLFRLHKLDFTYKEYCIDALFMQKDCCFEKKISAHHTCWNVSENVFILLHVFLGEKHDNLHTKNPSHWHCPCQMITRLIWCLDRLVPLVYDLYWYNLLEMKWCCFRPLLCTLFRLNWTMQAQGNERRWN